MALLGYSSLPNDIMIKYLLTLIRYDIPILMVGSSSIGKSYTILKLAKDFNIPNQILYVGSEKADNIEGLPRLFEKESEKSSNNGKGGAEILNYLMPYWFPNADEIQIKVLKGRSIFDQVNATCYKRSFQFNYEFLSQLLTELSSIKFPQNEDTVDGVINGVKFTFNKNKTTNDLESLCMFISTILGYGNYWVLLDELDKVDEMDADKYAPMLHIVRERVLKGRNLIEFNDGKGAEVYKVKSNDYEPIYKNLLYHLDNELSVLDTRIIAIGNQSENINDISEALFRRFVQVIITDVLVDGKVDEDTDYIKKCLEGKGSPQKYASEVDYAFLEEINLQWLYGFLPRIINEGDSGNFILSNFIKDITKGKQDIKDVDTDNLFLDSAKSALFKLLDDNFKPRAELRRNLIECIYDKLVGGSANQKKK